MNADQLKGKWMRFKGELKQEWGKFTDDDLQQIEGNYDKFVGKVQERYGDKKSEIMKWADAWHQKTPNAAEKKQAYWIEVSDDRRRTARNYISLKDEAITTRVKAQIAKDSSLMKAVIYTRTNAGVVSLSGEVQDFLTSAQASWTAWQGPGVKSVKNDLTVKEKA